MRYFLIIFLGLMAYAQALKPDTEYFVKAVAAYESEKNTEIKKQTVESALKLLEENSDYAYLSYWKAVFLTFDSELRDKGRLIPFSIIGRLSEIKTLLEKANQEYPSYHHHAPARTLGIMYLKMPSITGGSYKKSLEFLESAYAGAPDFPDNKKWLDQVRDEMK